MSVPIFLSRISIMYSFNEWCKAKQAIRYTGLVTCICCDIYVFFTLYVCEQVYYNYTFDIKCVMTIKKNEFSNIHLTGTKDR